MLLYCLPPYSSSLWGMPTPSYLSFASSCLHEPWFIVGLVGENKFPGWEPVASVLTPTLPCMHVVNPHLLVTVSLSRCFSSGTFVRFFLHRVGTRNKQSVTPLFASRALGALAVSDANSIHGTETGKSKYPIFVSNSPKWNIFCRAVMGEQDVEQYADFLNREPHLHSKPPALRFAVFFLANLPVRKQRRCNHTLLHMLLAKHHVCIMNKSTFTHH